MRLFVEAKGHGGNLCLLHGWSMNGAIWDNFSQLVGADMRVTCIDLPGHGFSPYDPGWDSIDAWADACLEVAPKRALWVGWSLGALISLKAALRAPARVGAIVAIAGTPRFVQTVDWPHAVPRGTLRQFASDLRSDYHRTLERFLALQVRGSTDAQGVLRRLRKRLAARPEPHAQALEVGLGLLRETDLRGDLSDIQCPILWLLGERDTLVPVSVTEELSASYPDTVWHVLKGAAHTPFLSHTRETAQAVRNFLK